MTLLKDIRKLLTLMVPILITQVSTAGITFINTAMTGHAGADDLAGVSVGGGLFYPILAAIVGLLMAGTPIMAQLIGAGNRERLPSVVHAGIVISLATALLLVAGYMLTVDGLMEYLALSPAVEYIARRYLITMIVTASLIALIIPFRCLTDTAGSTTISMRLFLLALPINAALDYLLVYGHLGLPRLGGIGAGIATSITYLCLLIAFVLVTLSRSELMGRAVFAGLSLKKQLVKEYLFIGIPSGLSIFMEMSLFSMLIVFLSRFGTDTLAAFQIADNFSSLIFMLPVSCGMALTILIATAVGQGDLAMAKRYRKAGLLTALAGAAGTAAFTILFRTHIGALYTADEAVASIAGSFLLFTVGWQLFDAMATPIQGILRGFKDTRVSFVLVVMAYWGGCLPMSLLLDRMTDLGAASYWLGLDFGVGLSALFMIGRLIYVERFLASADIANVRDTAALPLGGKALPLSAGMRSLRRYAIDPAVDTIFSIREYLIESLDAAIGRATKAFVP